MTIQSSIKQLRALLAGDANERPVPKDWRCAEKALGREIPGDFKALVTTFGTYNFGEWLPFNPASKNPSRTLVENTLKSGVATPRAYPELEIALYPEKSGALILGAGLSRWDFAWDSDAAYSDAQCWLWIHWSLGEIVPIRCSLPELLLRTYTQTRLSAEEQKIASHLWIGERSNDAAGGFQKRKR